MPSSSSLLFLLFLTIFQASIANTDIHFTSCSPFDCGNLRNISYPFWTDQLHRPSYCGFADDGYKLKCTQNEAEPPVLTLSSQQFRVLHLNASRDLLTIQRLDLNTCPREIPITPAFNYSGTAENITLFYGCGLHANQSLRCRRDGSQEFPVLVKDGQNGCVGGEKVEIPVEAKAFHDLMDGIAAVNESLLQPFDMKYYAYEGYCKECKDSGGRCGSNTSSPSTFACYCPHRPYQIRCHSVPRSGSNLGRKLLLGFARGAISLLITCIITLYLRRKTSCIITQFIQSNTDIEAFIRNNGTLSPKRYSYSDVRKMTNSFDELLGKGGYGSVYKGKLPDGHLVAVC